MLWPVELGREENRRRLEDLIRAAQLSVLPLQPPDLGMLLAGQTGPCPSVHFGLADPLAQRLRCSNAELLGHGADRWPVRGVLRPHLGDHPDRTLTQFWRVVPRSTSHGSIFLSRDGASGNSGAVQEEFAGHPAYGLDQLRDDLERFAFLPGGSDGESLFSPPCLT